MATVTKLGRQMGLTVSALIAECIAKVLFKTPVDHRSKIHMIFVLIFRIVFRTVDEDQSCR